MTTHVACNLMSASKRELLDAFHAASKRLLGDAGWRKRSGGIYTCDLGNGFHAWLGLNRSTKYRPVAINPVAGLRYEPLERLMRELSGLRGQATNATLAQNIGYIGDASPQSYVQLFIGGLDEAGPAAAELARLAERHALPFARQHASVAALERALRDGELVGHPERARQLLPALLVLEGRRDEADEALRAGLAEVAERDDLAAEFFREFAATLERRLADAPGDEGNEKPPG